MTEVTSDGIDAVGGGQEKGFERRVTRDVSDEYQDRRVIDGVGMRDLKEID